MMKITLKSLVVSACILVGAIHVYDHYNKISPVTRTIMLYESNGFGRRIWKGRDHESINLMKHPILEAETPPENQHSYILQPAVRHDRNNLTARISLSLWIPDTCELKPMSWVYSRGKWVPPRYTDSYTVYDTILEGVNDSVFYPAAEFGFESLHAETCKITYKFFGVDNNGRKIPPRDTTITMSLQ